jgi:hypothetical protein
MILGIPETEKDWRGFRAEEKALYAANYWKKKKIILEVRQPERYSSEDLEKKDLILTLLDGQKIAVQVKNYCDFKVIQECREARAFHFIIWQDEGEEIAKERMRDVIISAYISTLQPPQIRQLISKILEIKQLPSLTKK